jgi:hypothetical protein
MTGVGPYVWLQRKCIVWCGLVAPLDNESLKDQAFFVGTLTAPYSSAEQGNST